MPRIGSGGRGDDLKRRRPPIPLMCGGGERLMMVEALIMGAGYKAATVLTVKAKHKGRPEQAAFARYRR